MLHLRISGIVKFGSASSLGGTTLTGFTLPTAQRLFSKPGQLDTINVAAKSGTSPQQLVDEIKPILPRDAQVRTGAQQAQTDTNSLDSSLGFLNTLLLAFAGIALFVGAFVIANSLSITIAQRTREFATLRTLGASRRQVLRSVLAESLIIGRARLDRRARRRHLPRQGTVRAVQRGRAVAAQRRHGARRRGRSSSRSWSGIVVTMLASLRPALRATRVEPIAAVREGATLPPGRFARFRTAGSAVVIALGFLADRARPVRRPRHRAGAGADGCRRDPRVHRPVAAVGAVRARHGAVDRLAGDGDRGRDRPARARQRDAQPAADGVDRRRR